MQHLYNIDGGAYLSRIAGYLLGSRQLILSSTTYNPPASANLLLVECIGHGGVGASGGSSAAQVNACSGGGGGGYSASIISPNMAGKIGFTIVIGTGSGSNLGAATIALPNKIILCGAVGGAAGTNPGSGTTEIFTLGGVGAVVNSTNNAGDIQMAGKSAGAAHRISSTVGISGNGAPGPFGGGVSGRITAGAGANGGKYGAGGAGALSINNSGNPGGGTGGACCIIIWEFY